MAPGVTSGWSASVITTAFASESAATPARSDAAMPFLPVGRDDLLGAREVGTGRDGLGLGSEHDHDAQSVC